VKIDDVNKKTAGLSVATTGTPQTRTEKGPGVTQTTAPTAAQAENVTLSSQGKVASSAGVFDTNKVEEIKAAIANGQFKVNAESVADGLMDTVKDLISTRKA
jgi:negative regulator of flagellin synthesis FlgM